MKGLLPGQWEAMVGWFISGYPQEVVVAAFKDGTVQQLTNTHADPSNHFSISEKDELMMTWRHSRGEVLAYIHSHPDRSAEPSDHDYQNQMASGMTWGIVHLHGDQTSAVNHIEPPVFWGDEVDRGELLGRPYLWGINDCFTLFRDWHKERGIILPDAQRYKEDYLAGHASKTVFADWIRKSGFVPVETADKLAGDAVTFHYGEPQPSHVAIYLGEGKYLDALEKRLSGIRTLGSAEGRKLVNSRAQFYRLKGADDQGQTPRKTQLPSTP